MTKLTKEDIENFWIRVYFHGAKDLLGASVDRAYRDFNRTLHGIAKNQLTDSYHDLREVMIGIVKDLMTRKFNSQNQFDKWHQEMCDKLKAEFKLKRNHVINVGQAQKWINMTLKYLFALGDRVNGVSENYRYFHIPVDNIILKKLDFKFKKTWSRIDDYEDYLNFQIKVRQKYLDEIPMDVEFRLYNE
jgi:hypothetical protein